MGVVSGEGDNVAVAAAPPPEPAPIPQAEETPGEAVAPGANGTSPAAVPANAADVTDGAPVVLTASEDAWLKVYDTRGQTVRMGILNGGESYAVPGDPRSEEHTSELQSLMRNTYDELCMKQKKT